MSAIEILAVVGILGYVMFSLGVNRLAQAAVVVPRAMAMGVPFAPEKDGRVFMSGPSGRRNGQRGRDRW